MKKRLAKNNKLFLRFISTTDKDQRRAILRTLTDIQLQLLVEIIFNLIKGNLPLSVRNKQLLSQNKDNIRKIVTESISKQLRKKRLIKISEDIPIIVETFLRHESRVNTNVKEEV